MFSIKIQKVILLVSPRFQYDVKQIVFLFNKLKFLVENIVAVITEYKHEKADYHKDREMEDNFSSEIHFHAAGLFETVVGLPYE
jgi:hypothetical protein